MIKIYRSGEFKPIVGESFGGFVLTPKDSIYANGQWHKCGGELSDGQYSMWDLQSFDIVGAIPVWNWHPEGMDFNAHYSYYGWVSGVSPVFIADGDKDKADKRLVRKIQGSWTIYFESESPGAVWSNPVFRTPDDITLTDKVQTWFLKDTSSVVDDLQIINQVFES